MGVDIKKVDKLNGKKIVALQKDLKRELSSLLQEVSTYRSLDDNMKKHITNASETLDYAFPLTENPNDAKYLHTIISDLEAAKNNLVMNKDPFKSYDVIVGLFNFIEGKTKRYVSVSISNFPDSVNIKKLAKESDENKIRLSIQNFEFAMDDEVKKAEYFQLREQQLKEEFESVKGNKIAEDRVKYKLIDNRKAFDQCASRLSQLRSVSQDYRVAEAIKANRVTENEVDTYISKKKAAKQAAKVAKADIKLAKKEIKRQEKGKDSKLAELEELQSTYINKVNDGKTELSSADNILGENISVAEEASYKTHQSLDELNDELFKELGIE